MLLVIHNLPFNSKYADIKALIKSKCGVTEVILDNLVTEGQTKKVTVGLADAGDGAILVRKINGIFVGGQQLYVEDVRQKKESEQPYRSSKSLLAEPQIYNQSSYNTFPQSGYQRDMTPQNQGLQPATSYNMGYQNPDMNNMMMNVPAVGGMYYVPNMAQPQNSYMGYGGQMEMAPLMPQVPDQGNSGPLDRPFGFDRPEENTHRDRQRPSYDRREPSPLRGGRDRDRQSSRYEGQSEARSQPRRRSPSPRRRHYDSRPDNQKTYNSYEEDLRSRNLNQLQSQNYQQPQQQMYSNNFNLNYGGSNATMMDSAWGQVQQPVYDQNQFVQSDSNMAGGNDYGRPKYENPRSDYQNARSDYQNPRSERNPPPRDSIPYESRSSRGGPGSSRQSDNRRDDSRLPPKRGNKYNDDGPQPKRFAQSYDSPRGPSNAPRGPPNTGPRGPSNAGPRGLSNAGPRGPSNVQNRPGNPKFGKTGPPTAANKFAQPNSGAKTVAPNDNQQNTSEPLWKLLNRDETWRGQAAAALANEMLLNLKVELPAGERIVKHLKQSIRARINVMLGDTIGNRPEAIRKMYDQKFPPSGNQELFSSVVNDLAKIQKEGGEAAKNPPSEGSGPVKPKPSKAKVPKPGVLQTPQPVNPPPRNPPQTGKNKNPGSTKHLPKFPAADKKEFKKIKADLKKSWKNEDSLPCLPEDLQKAMDDELNALSDIFMSSCTPDCDEEKKLCEEISDVVSDEFRKVIRIHLTKRLAKDNSDLRVRMFGKIKSTNRQQVEAFLAKCGCVAINKSERMGVMNLAHFDNYDNYDKILNMGEVRINNLPFSFKPFELCGPATSAAERRQVNVNMRQRFKESQVDQSNENILQPGYVYEHPKQVVQRKQVVYTIQPIQDTTAEESNVQETKNLDDDGPTDTQDDEAIPIDDGDDNVNEDDLEDW